jgi:hypothetical protein
VITAVAVCVGAGALFGLLAPFAGRRLSPRAATWLLAAGSVFTAGGSAFALAAMATMWLGQLTDVAELGDWSATSVRHDAPLPVPAAMGAGGLLAVLLACATAAAVRRVAGIHRSHRAFAALAAPGEVAVLDSPVPEAFATPDPAGRIIVTTALYELLDAPQRRALIAHERSHLVHRHAWWRVAAELAAAVDPLLRPAATAVRDASERWADEDAARVVGDRRVVATAISRAAIARRGSALTAASGGRVPERVRALLQPTTRRRPILAAVLVAVLAVTAAGAIAVERAGDRVFDHASVSAPRD